MDKPQLRLLAEVNRLARLAFAHQPPVEPEVAWQALEREPLTEKDRPGFLARLLPPRLVHHSFGDSLRVQRDAFFCTGLVPFTAIALPGGGVAVAFRAIVRRDLAPVVLRFAVDRLFTAHGWTFPDELANPSAFAAVVELAFGFERGLRLQPGAGVPAGDQGEVPVERVAPREWETDAVTLRWTPRTLAFHSPRLDIL